MSSDSPSRGGFFGPSKVAGQEAADVPRAIAWSCLSLGASVYSAWVLVQGGGRLDSTGQTIALASAFGLVSGLNALYFSRDAGRERIATRLPSAIPLLDVVVFAVAMS